MIKYLYKNASMRVWTIVSAVLLIIILVANILCVTWLAPLFNLALGRPRAILGSGGEKQYTRDYDTKEEAYEAGIALSNEIIEEGAVLLKNTGALPISTSASNKTKISVFGKNSVDLSYGGSGSGGASHEGAKTLYESLTAANFDWNPTLKSFYDGKESGEGRPSNPGIEGGISYRLITGETPWSMYTESVKNSFSNYNTAALIVITRIGGEGFDLPRGHASKEGPGGHGENAQAAGDHFLRLDTNERRLIDEVVAAGFSNVILILNTNNPLELGFVKDEIGITGCLWIGTPGDAGVMGLGRILNGTVSPSGRTVDTYSRDYTKDPTYQNFGDMNRIQGENYRLASGSLSKHTYVDYEEDIYVGYRYFETRAAHPHPEDAPDWYNQNVAYPFGYGLSYAKFSQKFVANTKPSSITNSKFTVNVEVTHEASSIYAGSAKDVVQIYVTVPYSDDGLEKSHVVLAAFAKSPLIARGQSAVVEVEIDPYLFASYDKNTDGGCFVLEAGNYDIKLGKNAHEVYETHTVNSVPLIKFKNGGNLSDHSKEKNQVKNRYSDGDYRSDENLGTTLSRSNWKDTFPKSRTNEERMISKALQDKIESKATNNPLSVPMELYPEFGVDNGILFTDMVGVPYDDPKWDAFLDQLTIEEMTLLSKEGQFLTEKVERLKVPMTVHADGPFGFVSFMKDSAIYGCMYYPSQVVLASTWNPELAEKAGVTIGNEALVGNEKGDGLPYSGWYAPGVNIHRSPFGGRVGEYYSEDPIMSGKMAAALIRGARSKGLMTFVKHFAVNEQEISRTGISTWLTEQALREIYLRPFELAVTEGETVAVMSAFNRIGAMWAGGDYRLLTEILRNEWGFEGVVICDYFVGNDVANAKQMVYAGGDLHLMAVTATTFSPNIGSATDVAILRTATKNILFAVANSSITDYDIIGYRLAPWMVGMIVIDIVLVVCLAAWGTLVMLKLVKKKRVYDSADKA